MTFNNNKKKNKLCGLYCICHNMPPPPASGDLNSHPKLSGWRSPRTSVMQVIVFRSYANFEVRRPSRFEDIKVKEADLYSAFIEVPYTQGAHVQITQCYLQTTPYLPLPRKHSPMAQPRLRLRTSNCSLLLIYLTRKDERLSWPGWLVT